MECLKQTLRSGSTAVSHVDGGWERLPRGARHLPRSCRQLTGHPPSAQTLIAEQLLTAAYHQSPLLTAQSSIPNQKSQHGDQEKGQDKSFAHAEKRGRHLHGEGDAAVLLEGVGGIVGVQHCEAILHLRGSCRRRQRLGGLRSQVKLSCS